MKLGEKTFLSGSGLLGDVKVWEGVKSGEECVGEIR